MARYSLLIFIISLETLQTVYCVSGNDSFNPFSPPQRNKKTELKNSDLAEERGISFEGVPSEEKIIEKRRLLFNDGEVNSQASAGREFENNEYPARMRTNYSVPETETQVPEYQKGFHNWENKQNGFSFSAESGNSRNIPEFRLKQPFVGQPNSNLNLDWGQRTDIFETRQSQWNEGKNVKQIANSDSDLKIAAHYNGRIGPTINENGVTSSRFHPGRNGELFSGRVSMTMLNDEGIENPKSYDDRVAEVNRDYQSHPNINYYNRKAKGFWSPNFYRPEKGVIINFNTECPAPRQLNNQMVHKFIFTPKPSVTALPEISPLQIPETAFVSTHKMSPIYYL